MKTTDNKLIGFFLARDRSWFIAWLLSVSGVGIWDVLFLNRPALNRIVEGFINTFTIAFIVVGYLVNVFLPRQTEKIVTLLRDSFWKSLWVGLAFIVLSPVCIALCLGTVSGLPAGIMAAFIFVMMLYILLFYGGI